MPVNDPILYLREEHEHALAALDRLERAADNLGSASDALRAIREAVEFVDCEVRRHNEREERILFPRLEARTGEGDPVSAILRERRDLWGNLDNLQSDLNGVREDPYGGARFFESIRLESLKIVALLRLHIEKENQIVFRMADEALSPEEKLEMAEEMELLIGEGERIG